MFAEWKLFVDLTEQWSITCKLIWRNIQLDIKKCFTYEYVKTCLNKFNMYILSELENMLHVVHVVLVLLPLLSVFFLKFKRFKLIHLRWPPAVRIKSCLLSYTFHTIWLPRTNFKWRYKNEGNSYHTRMKFVPKLPTKKLQTSITAFHCW